MDLQKKVLICVALTAVVVLGLVFHLASLTENDWIGIKQVTHPPTVEIMRSNHTIMIRWYGGWDQQFIDHVRVCTSIAPCKKYVKPEPGRYIAITTLEENVTVEVSGWDLAGQYYHPIATATV
jgi:hypothetical protein